MYFKLNMFWVFLFLVLFIFGCVSENKTSLELIESAYASQELTKEEYFIQKSYSAFHPELLNEKFKGRENPNADYTSFLIEIQLNIDSFSPETQKILLPFILPADNPESYWYSKNSIKTKIELKEKNLNKIYFSEEKINEPKTDVTLLTPENYSQSKKETISSAFKKAYSKYVDELNLKHPDKVIINIKEGLLENKLVPRQGNAFPFFGACNINIDSTLSEQSLQIVVAHELFHCFQFENLGLWNSAKIFLKNTELIEPCAYYSEELVFGTNTINPFNLSFAEKESCKITTFHLTNEKEIQEKKQENAKKEENNEKTEKDSFESTENPELKNNEEESDLAGEENSNSSVEKKQLIQENPWPEKIELGVSSKVPINTKKFVLVKPETKKYGVLDIPSTSEISAPKVIPEKEIPGISFKINSLNSEQKEPYELEIIADYELIRKQNSGKLPLVIEQELMVDYDLFAEEDPKINLKINLNEPGLIVFGVPFVQGKDDKKLFDELSSLLLELASVKGWDLINFNSLCGWDCISKNEENETAEKVHELISKNHGNKKFDYLLIIGDSIYFPYSSDNPSELSSLFYTDYETLDGVYYSDVDLDGIIDLKFGREPLDFIDLRNAKKYLEKKYFNELPELTSNKYKSLLFNYNADYSQGIAFDLFSGINFFPEEKKDGTALLDTLKNFDYVLYSGHGNSEGLNCSEGETLYSELLTANPELNEFIFNKNPIIWARSCYSANSFGLALMNSGARNLFAFKADSLTANHPLYKPNASAGEIVKDYLNDYSQEKIFLFEYYSSELKKTGDNDYAVLLQNLGSNV
ncbi:MAG: hypothetical protein JW703_04540, partial [Candidatus Diapherotrites archaeon]|nr:hypothetical protein [Candidatus Diapherotrites archaeon]